jgi:hypothetical protein
MSRTASLAVTVLLAVVFTAASTVLIVLPSMIKARSVPAPVSEPVRVRSQGTLVSDFNDLGDWAYDASHGMEEGGGTDRADLAFEGSAVRLTTPRTAGSSAWITRHGLSLGIGDAGTFSFWVDIADAHRIESIAVYAAADRAFEKYFAASIDVTGEIAPGPQMMAISVGEMKSYGGMTPRDLVTTFQLRITSKTGDGSISFDHLYYNRRSIPKIVISFDDNWLTQYTEAFPYMSDRGIPGTIYAIQETVGAERYMSLQDLKTVYTAGWDIGNHTSDHMGFNSDASRVPLMWGRKLFTLARPQVPNLRVALNGDLSQNGKAVLSPPRIVVIHVERSSEDSQAVKTFATIVGLDRSGKILTETVPIAAFDLVSTNNEFAEVWEITFAAPPQARITVGVAQAGDTTVSSLLGCTRFLIANGMARGAYHVAYPQGERNRVTDQAMGAIDMRTGRMITGRSTPTADGLVNPYSIQALSPNARTPLAALTRMADMAIDHGATTFVVFHRIEPDPAVSTDYSVADFRKFIDYVVQKRNEGLLEPVTISNWFESLPNKDGIPMAERDRTPDFARRQVGPEVPDGNSQE